MSQTNPYSVVSVRDEHKNPYAMPRAEDQAVAGLTAAPHGQAGFRGQARELALRLNLPQDVVERNAAEASAIAQENEFRFTLSERREFAEWLANPDNAALARDDIPALTRIVDVARAVPGEAISFAGRQVRGGGVLVERGLVEKVIYADMGLAAFYNTPTEASVTIGEGIQDVGGAVVDAGGVVSPPVERQTFATDVSGAVGQLGAAIVQSAVAPPTVLPGLFAVGVDEQNERSDGAAPDSALLLGGVVTAGTEKLGLDFITRKVPEAIKQPVGRFLTDLMTSAAVEGVQEATEQVGQNLVERTYNPDAEVFEGAGEAASVSAAAGLIVRSLLLTAAPGRMREDRTIAGMEQVDAVAEAAKESKLFERSRAALESLLQQVGDGAEVYVPAEAALQLFQLETLVAERLGVDPSAVEQARYEGGDIAVPLEKIISTVDEAFFPMLRENIRPTPDALTLAEAVDQNQRETLQADFESIYDDLEASDKVASAGAVIADDVAGQLMNAGASPEVARTQASLWQALFETLEAKGVDAASAYEALGLRVQGPEQETTGPRTDQLDLLLDDLRAGREPQLSQEDRLSGFVRALGVRDDRGDLASQDLDAQRRPGQRNLLRDDGLSLDEVGERATEAGYFAERPTKAALIDAILADARDEAPLYPEGSIDPVAEQRIAALRALDADLREAGIDLAEATNEQVKERLNGEAEPESDGRTLDQSERASVTFPVDGVFSDGEVVVRLTQASDLTSFLHESAHVFLEMYQALSESEPVIAKELATIREWLGADAFSELTREQHETFAEGFETYLFEGKSPSIGLQTAFNRFRAWMMSIYRRVQNMGVQLDETARGVFDAMLATEQEARIAREARSMRVSVLLRGLMKEEQAQRYEGLVETARAELETKLLRQAIDEIRTRESAAYRQERAAIRKEADADVWARPVYRAFHLFMEGSLREGDTSDRLQNVRLSKEAIISLRGEAAIPRLLRGKRAVYADDGVHPDIIASELGFSSGDALVDALLKAPKPKAAIEDATDMEMRRRHGDVLNDGTIEREAAERVYSESQGRVLMAEQNALAAKALQKALPHAQIKAAARDLINRQPISHAIKPGRYSLQALNQGKKAIRLAAQGKFLEALQAKQQQVLNHELARLAYLAQRRVERIERDARRALIRKYDEKRYHPDYVEPIKRLAGLYLGRTDNPVADRKFLLDWWLERLNTDQRYADIPLRVVETDRPFVKAWRDLSYEDVLDFKSSLDSLSAAARHDSDETKSQLRDEAKGLANNIRCNNPKPPRDSRAAPEKRRRWFDALHGFWADLQSASVIIEALDGRADGPLYEAIWVGLRQGQSKTAELKTEMAEGMAKVFEGYKPAELEEQIHVPSLGRSYPRQFVMSVAQHMGSQSNRDAIFRAMNTHYDMGEFQVNDMLSRLREKDWNTVQAVWDLIDTYWPQASEVTKKIEGVVPPKVEAAAFSTPSGQRLSGGYYPLSYEDPTGAAEASLDDGKLAAQLMSGARAREGTPKGHMIARQGSGGRKVRLDYGTLTRHLDNQAAMIGMREPLVRAVSILNQRSVRAAISETLGPDYIEALNKIVTRSAAGYHEPSTSLGRLMRNARTNATVAYLGLSMRTMLVQPLGVAQSVESLGLVNVLDGYRRFLSDRAGAASFAFDRSPVEGDSKTAWVTKDGWTPVYNGDGMV
ncbi:MAG: hypothetical protein AAF225_11675, partial [Pseudomonadota bacterium]